MSTHEAFKRRIRARMAKTGERYGAARRALLAEAGDRPRTGWVSQPEVVDESLRTATGRGWDDWCALIDDEVGRSAGHSAIAAHLVAEHCVDSWWSQTITVGYERIRGLRLPYQQGDGTFTASRSRTVDIDAEILRAMLLDEDDRAGLFPAFETELRSRPTSKNIRLAIGGGVAEFTIATTDAGRVKVTVAHAKLTAAEDVAIWQQFWADWIEELDDPADHSEEGGQSATMA